MDLPLDEELQKDQQEVIEWVPANYTRQSDITLVIESWRFHVHRDILMRSSDYFRAMFSSHMIESRKGVVEMYLVSPEVFSILVEGMYTGCLALTEDNAFAVVQAAEMLHIGDPLNSVYLSFMRKALMNISHCFELMHFCIPFNLTELYSDARKFCLAHFWELKDCSALTSLSLSELYDYLSDTYLVVEAEVHVVEAIYAWLCANKNSIPYSSQDFGLKNKVKKMILECVSLKKVDEDTLDILMNAVFNDERLPVEHFKSCLAARKRQEDVFMFWAMLTSSRMTEGLVDILRLDLETGNAVKFGTMTDIVKKPGFQLGSAICDFGPYVYISGGGPDFGKVNWIRQIWRFDVSKPYAPWETVGDLIEFRRNHTMVILNQKLYMFGGFGRYRLKNVKMHSLDLNSGDWEQLAPMPVHEFDPPATTTNTCIYYISSHWTLHCFSLETKDWTHLDILTPPEPGHPEIRPLTLFPFEAEESSCFAIASLFRDTLKIQLLRAHAPSLTLQTFREVADMPIYFTFRDSVKFNGKLVLFFTSMKSGDLLSGLNESTTAFLNAWSFDPMISEYSCFPDIRNVRQALSIAALPFFPDMFSLECKELL